MTLKSDAKFEEKLIYCFKNDKTLVNFDQNTRNSHFDCSFCAKYIMYRGVQSTEEYKKYRGVIFHDTEE